ncbi:taurine catabolism dioxygenase TauD, TfdA family protein [Burkholderia pseudomallei MSHR2451]|uniref:TauD/TfdA family dioxygenase n=1 Tax=Burkholderia pseudomallei TaxID=28450 RepID=UPI00053687BD|nr:TauD/TfdA family dioxygenase [Burkholderia pseudomallei]KGW21299.1 taurine catabolism dioxygenase TauD, TfdA family protein [Burkholderia pseudomallei MSHR2451]
MNVQPLFGQAQHHPVVVTPRGDVSLHALRDYLADDAEGVARLLREHGGVLFRGFGLNGADDFRAITECLGAKPFGYVGGDSPRSRVAPGVYTSTDHPASERISLHNEMSYLPAYPRRLFFYCLVPAASGGQTPLAHGGDVLRAVPADIVERLSRNRINYVRNFPAVRLGKSWQDTYQTNDRAEVERIAAEQGSTCAWLPQGLRVTTPCDAIVTHPRTGDALWFNQAELWHPSALAPRLRSTFEQLVGKGNLPHECEYGNGEPIGADVLAEIRRALQANKLMFDWRRGDLLMIDNLTMMHGREAFRGERKTLAYLSGT